MTNDTRWTLRNVKNPNGGAPVLFRFNAEAVQVFVNVTVPHPDDESPAQYAARLTEMTDDLFDPKFEVDTHLGWMGGSPHAESELLVNGWRTATDAENALLDSV